MMEKVKPGGRHGRQTSPTEHAVLVSTGWKENRRRFRSPIELPVRITARNDGGAGTCVTATCTDFSDDGVAFETGLELQVGEVVFFEFIMAGESQSSDRSFVRVIHRKATRYGACFVKPVAR
jgi:PilZ domain